MRETLLLDHAGIASVMLLESTKSGRTRFGGIFQEAEKINKNQRLYHKSILESNVERLQEAIEKGNLLGELDHPNTSVTALQNVALSVKKLYWDGNTLYGEAETIETPNGLILKSLLEAGIPVGLSSRSVGSGSTNSEGIFVVGDNLKIITWDAVCDPSVSTAYQKIIAKNESFKETFIKNESTSINKLNTNMLISYFGQLVNEKSKLLKEGLKHE